MLQPFQEQVYDPAMGSGGFFVQSENFIKEHGGRLGNVSIYGQEYNHTTWQRAAMNMVIRGLDFNFGKEPANTFTNDQHPDLRADYIMVNPPFNMKEWDTGISDDDPRWQYGRPPSGNANFAWLQHMLYHLFAMPPDIKSVVYPHFCFFRSGPWQVDKCENNSRRDSGFVLDHGSTYCLEFERRWKMSSIKW